MLKITTHTVVKNEENWIWYSLMSVRDFADEILVVDDNSSDQTVKIIQSIKDPKIKLQGKKLYDPAELTKIRNDMITQTKTDWFLLLDGDEVWGGTMLTNFLEFIAKQPKTIYGVAMRTRNCVGDIFHYQSEEAGRYKLAGRVGHLTIRAYRKLPGFSWRGDYPLEAYTDKNGIPINEQNKHVAFFDGFYWHMTHLPRTSAHSDRKHDQITKLEMGIPTDKAELPEVFFLPHLEFVPSPFRKLLPKQKILAQLITPFRRIKRKILK